jgi:hypothetical protein
MPGVASARAPSSKENYVRQHLLLLAVGSLCAVTGWSQTSSGTGAASTTQAINAQNANNVCRVYFQKPKAGQTAQFEQARVKHFQFHKSHNDSWTWETSVVETGPSTGTYVVATCGHSWKDFDDWEKKMGKEDTADAMANMGPFLEENDNGFFIYRADMSLAPPNTPPAPMSSVTIYVLHPGMGDDFIGAVKKINEALKKEPSWPKTSGWYQLASGGQAPEFVIVGARQGWADFAPLDKSIRDVVTANYGQETADGIFKTMRDSAEKVIVEADVHRADLSYEPK